VQRFTSPLAALVVVVLAMGPPASGWAAALASRPAATSAASSSSTSGSPSTLTLLPPIASAAKAVWAKAQAELFWKVRGISILAGFHSGASAGQCTDLVAERRPDIIARVDVWAYAHRLLSSTREPIVLVVNWAGKAWAANASEAGIPVGSKPQPGAVIVFQPGAYGASADGHVAIVDSVQPSGGFTISEMHAPNLGVVTTRQFDAGTARRMSRSRGVSFIYL
jgi:surface antigen